MQITIAQFLLSQVQSEVARVRSRLREQADEDGEVLDYEELDRVLDSAEQDEEWINEVWA